MEEEKKERINKRAHQETITRNEKRALFFLKKNHSNKPERTRQTWQNIAAPARSGMPSLNGASEYMTGRNGQTHRAARSVRNTKDKLKVRLERFEVRWERFATYRRRTRACIPERPTQQKRASGARSCNTTNYSTFGENNSVAGLCFSGSRTEPQNRCSAFNKRPTDSQPFFEVGFFTPV